MVLTTITVPFFCFWTDSICTTGLLTWEFQQWHQWLLFAFDLWYLLISTSLTVHGFIFGNQQQQTDTLLHNKFLSFTISDWSNVILLQSYLQHVDWLCPSSLSLCVCLCESTHILLYTAHSDSPIQSNFLFILHVDYYLVDFCIFTTHCKYKVNKNPTPSVFTALKTKHWEELCPLLF